MSYLRTIDRNVDLFPATLLILAASLKTGELFLTSQGNLLSGAEFGAMCALIALEFTVGVVLLSRAHHRIFAVTGIILFTLFAVYSAALAITGELSCGCFGFLTINPRYMLLIDVACIFFLTRSALSPVSSCDFNALPIRVLTIFLCAFFVLSLLRAQPTDNQYTLSEDVVIGARLPVLDDIDGSHEMDIGTWDILIVDSGCKTCESLLAESYFYCTQATCKAGKGVVDLSGESIKTDNVPFLQRASTQHRWTSSPPLLVRINDGAIVSVTPRKTVDKLWVIQ